MKALTFMWAITMAGLTGPVFSGDDMDTRVDDLVSELTLEEKVSLCTGADHMATRAIERLGIPALNMADGPVGVRWDTATCFPSSIAMAATWDPALVEDMASALAREFRGKGRNLVLGPCVNIHRVPHGGRNFESFGEDPWLASRITVAYIRGVQSQGAAACVKHFACNNQEWERGTISSEVDERTLREIYLPAFEAAVREADVLSLMSAYNRVNGQYCSENYHLLREVLKKEWGFRGIVISDWGACHSTVESAVNGLDVEMPGPGHHLAAPLLEAVRRGDVSEKVVEEMARNVVRTALRVQEMERAVPVGPEAVGSPRSTSAARKVAAAAMVLLKNDQGVLPLRPDLGRLALIGPNATDAQVGGGGSSSVSPPYAVSPFDGLREAVGENVSVRYAEGCCRPGDLAAVPSDCLRTVENEPGLRAEYFANADLQGRPALVRTDAAVDFHWGMSEPVPGVATPGYSVRWTGTLTIPESGEFEFGAVSEGGVRIRLDGRTVVDRWEQVDGSTASANVQLRAGQSLQVEIEYAMRGGWSRFRFGWRRDDDAIMAEAVSLAAEVDAVVLCVGLSSHYEGEGHDRSELSLPGRQAELIRKVAAVNPRTAVVLFAGSPVLMEEWADGVPAILCAWYPGQECGRALADVLLGRVNPSGRLPMTWLRRWEDSPAHGHYPGGDGRVRYQEGIFVGYRHFDANHLEPRFPFGHGLSYSRFDYSDVSLQSAGEETIVRFKVANTGPVAGAEIAQVYVADAESSLPRPPRELKGFQKVELAAGASAEVEVRLGPRAFSYYDVESRNWRLEPGRFQILVGSSSRDIRLRKDIEK